MRRRELSKAKPIEQMTLCIRLLHRLLTLITEPVESLNTALDSATGCLNSPSVGSRENHEQRISLIDSIVDVVVTGKGNCGGEAIVSLLWKTYVSQVPTTILEKLVKGVPSSPFDEFLESVLLFIVK